MSMQRSPRHSSFAICRALDRRYPIEKGWAPATEVANSSASRYADYVAFRCFHPPTVIGHEIKVTRSDFLRELDDAGKRDWVNKNCQRRWFVAPKGLILPAELPEGWGLMEVIGNVEEPKLRQKVAAPIVRTAFDPPLWLMRALWKASAEAHRHERATADLQEKLSGEHLVKQELAFEEKQRALRNSKIEMNNEKRRLDDVWRELLRLAGERINWREPVQCKDAKYLFSKMKLQAAEEVVREAKAARAACDRLLKAAEESIENRDIKPENEDSTSVSL